MSDLWRWWWWDEEGSEESDDDEPTDPNDVGSDLEIDDRLFLDRKSFLGFMLLTSFMAAMGGEMVERERGERGNVGKQLRGKREEDGGDLMVGEKERPWQLPGSFLVSRWALADYILFGFLIILFYRKFVPTDPNTSETVQCT